MKRTEDKGVIMRNPARTLNTLLFADVTIKIISQIPAKIVHLYASWFLLHFLSLLVFVQSHMRCLVLDVLLTLP